jgi:hypothetical protein
MDNKILQICVANRFGVDIFEKHTCHCGFTVSNYGHHGLTCPKNKGRFSTFKSKSNYPASLKFYPLLKPCGLLRDDGKRPDGATTATLIPWSKGQRLM